MEIHRWTTLGQRVMRLEGPMALMKGSSFFNGDSHVTYNFSFSPSIVEATIIVRWLEGENNWLFW